MTLSHFLFSCIIAFKKKKSKYFCLPTGCFFKDDNSQPGCSREAMGLYGNSIDVTRYSRKDGSSLIHGGDCNWGGLTVGLDSIYIP